MSGVLIIGIQALDSILLSRFENDLPNFRQLKQWSPDLKLTSILSSDSGRAWASIYASLNVTRYGMINSGKDTLPLVADCHFQRETFWDFASSIARVMVCIRSLKSSNRTRSGFLNSLTLIDTSQEIEN